jgi:hypothetical protein
MSNDEDTAVTPSPKPTDTGIYIAHEVKALLEEFRVELKSDLDKQVSGVNTLVKQQADRTIVAQEGTRRQVVHLTKMTYSLWRNVRGSDPPPPPPAANEAEDISFAEAAKDPLRQTGSNRAIKPLDDLTEELEKNAALVSTHDGDIAAVQGRLLVVETQNKMVIRQNEEVIGQNAELLKLQKEQMGKKDPKDVRGALTRLVDGVIWAFKEREGQKFTMIVLGGATSLITAIGTTYALISGRLPMPTHPPPQPPAFIQSHGAP